MRAVRSKRMSEWCERTSERRSEWPSTLRVDFIVIQPTVLWFCTCMMLSSETEQTTQGSLGFHEKSLILAVCPPWMKSNSGGPSSAS